MPCFDDPFWPFNKNIIKWNLNCAGVAGPDLHAAKQMRTGHCTHQIHPGCSWVTFTIDDYDCLLNTLHVVKSLELIWCDFELQYWCYLHLNVFLGKDKFVRKHQEKDRFRRSKQGGPTCRSFLFVFVVAAAVLSCLFACFMLFTTFAMPRT